jgi:low affinity Fe/Cu permease
MNDLFRKIAQRASNLMGSAWAFIVATLSIVVWAVTGPLFHFSDTWQLVINTWTNLVTFLMVFLIQNSQSRDSKATLLKLDELIRSQAGARNALINLEGLSEAELERFDLSARKLGPRDLAAAVVQRAPGATTVGGTLIVAAATGIRFMATGGLGGVHGLGTRARGGRGLRGGSLGSGRLAQRRSGLAGCGLRALRLARLAGGDPGLGGLRSSGLARRLDDPPARLDVVATDRGIDLAGQARLAASGGVGMDGTDLGGAIEGAERLDQRSHRVDRRVGGLRDGAQSLGDIGLRGAAARLEDFVAALGLTDPL